MAEKAKSLNTQTQSTILPANSRSAQRSRAGRDTSTIPVVAYQVQKHELTDQGKILKLWDKFLAKDLIKRFAPRNQ